MKKSITLNQSAVSHKITVNVKAFLKNISPFNNKANMPPGLLVLKKLLAFAVCYCGGLFLAEGIIIGFFFACGKNFLQGEMFSDDVMLLIKLCGMSILIAVSLLYLKLIEKRKLSEIGVTKNISGWLIGAGVGVLLLIVSVSAIMLTGTIKYGGFSTDINISMMLLMLGGYTVQGAAEELLCRGLVFCSLKDKVSLPAAVGASTLVFILPHLSTLSCSEPLFIISGVVNLAVISCVFSFITLRTKSILAACGLHSMWNFCLSCVLGLDLSGSEGTVYIINMHTAGKNLLNGGKYGIEASVITGIVLTAAAVLLWYLYKNDIKERQA
jgi:membrane protease YdiL (CAAX protease family)